MTKLHLPYYKEMTKIRGTKHFYSIQGVNPLYLSPPESNPGFRDSAYDLNKRRLKTFLKIFFGEQECVGHSFAYVSHFVFLRYVCIQTQRVSPASRCANNLATQLNFFFFFFSSKGGLLYFFSFFLNVIQHCFICLPSDSTVSKDAGIEPKTFATLALTARRSITTRLLDFIHSARSQPLDPIFSFGSSLNITFYYYSSSHENDALRTISTFLFSFSI